MRSTAWIALSLFLTACGGGGSETEPVEIAQDDLVVIANDQSLGIYLPADEETSEYISYQLFEDQGLWRLGEAHLATRFPDTAKFKRAYSGYSIVNNGEWSRAIFEEGAPDFIGGFHANETTSSVELNGGPVWKEGRKVVKSLVLSTESELYRYETETKIAEISTTYDFNAKRLQVSQKITWLEAVDVETAYLSMFPIKRKLPNGEQITDMGYRSPDYEPEDILTEGFPIEMTTGTRVVRLEGSWSDLVAEVSVESISGVPEPEVFISNSSRYNKVYFNFASDAASGDVWEVVTSYKITK
tara:strand:- start:1209 stop:2108 length:900 start_codon:yes stop_codon:yes gene_type:complete